MTLSFSEKWADGSPTYFIPKIWKGIYSQHKDQFHKYCDEQYLDVLKEGLGNFDPKVHTIREDKKDRWKAGNKIHPVINNRTPNRFQFAPTLECKSVQKLQINQHNFDTITVRSVFIDDEILFYRNIFLGSSYQSMLQFVKNDGFDDIESFFNFFFPNGTEGTKTLKLIHWTDLKY